MPETITPALRAYLTDWLSWAEAGARTKRFDREFGLCTNAPFAAAYDLRDALVADFGGNASYPFDCLDVYLVESKTGTHHTNPLRLAWVRAQLAKPDSG